MHRMAAFEKSVQARILQGLRQHGAYIVKVHNAGRQRKGIPDILCCYKGYFIAIEVKGANGALRNDQKKELHSVKAAGGCAVVAHTWMDVKQVLADIDFLDRDNNSRRAVECSSRGIPVASVVELDD